MFFTWQGGCRILQTVMQRLHYEVNIDMFNFFVRIHGYRTDCQSKHVPDASFGGKTFLIGEEVVSCTGVMLYKNLQPHR